MNPTRLILPFVVAVLFTGVRAQERLYHNAFPLGDVVLLDGPFKHARDLNIEVLLRYDVDRLLAPYRKEAGLAPKARSYTSWEGLDGHIAGHYLSALALNSAATHEPRCRERLAYMIAELKACQEANARNNPEWGSGYLGGVPQSKTIWTALRVGDLGPYRKAWVPWYNVHKMYAGLRDAWSYAGNDEARRMFLEFCDWGIAITSALSDSLMQSMLDTEHGGMAEVFADAYQITGEKKYLEAAKRFSHRMILDAMAEGRDNLDNKHANTQIPKVIGFARIAELTHDAQYARASRFFWETVTRNRTLVFGGNSRREFFPSPSACSDYVNDVEGPESCNSYNMLKLTEDLFRVNPSRPYLDYYERTLYNHILSTQHPVHGGYVYFTPVRPRHYRVYSAPNAAMWCCVGSGMENHSKYNEMIYTHTGDSLFLNLFIASALHWREKGVELTQETRFPYEEKSKLVVTRGGSRFTLMIRNPSWVEKGALTVLVNGQPVSSSTQAPFVGIEREWKTGDIVQIALPMHNTIEHLPNVPAYIAFLHGPIVLAARAGTEDLAGLVADDGRWGHIPGGKRLPIDKAPIFLDDDIPNIAARLEPAKGRPLTFTMSSVRMINPARVILEPFFTIHDARYSIYWMAQSTKEYHAYLDSIASAENERLAIEGRTVDAVAPGEQQPEVDHGLQSLNSNSGTSNDAFWRDAADGGYFSYSLATHGEAALTLRVRYWGNEWGGRKFSIFIDDEALLTEDNTGKWNQSKFEDVSYTIPDSLVKNKPRINVRFQALPGNTAGAVYSVRLLRP